MPRVLGTCERTMIFAITRDSTQAMLKRTYEAPDGMVDLSETAERLDGLTKEIICCDYARRSSTVDLIARLSEFALSSKPEFADEEQRSVSEICAVLATSILIAALLKGCNGIAGFDCPQDVLATELSPRLIDRLRMELKQVPFRYTNADDDVAYIDLTGCSTLDGVLASHVFITPVEDSAELESDYPSPKVNLSEIRDRIVPDDPKDSNPYDDDDWRPWGLNNEPPLTDQ